MSRGIGETWEIERERGCRPSRGWFNKSYTKIGVNKCLHKRDTYIAYRPNGCSKTIGLGLLTNLLLSVLIAVAKSSLHFILTASVVLLGGNEAGAFLPSLSFSLSFLSLSFDFSSLSLLGFFELLVGVSLPVPEYLVF